MAFLLLCSVASAATLNVGPKEKYKTIQSAVNAAKNGDTIKVAYGTYKETVTIDKYLTIFGTKYPKVYGFDYKEGGGGGTINGFSIQKTGVTAFYADNDGIIRNNYFYNCGIYIGGSTASGITVMNNQIIGGTITVYDTKGQIITGNTVSKSKCGLYIGDSAGPQSVTKNSFKSCGYGVYIFAYEDPGKLINFTGNKYTGNKVNIGWGTKTF